MKYWYFKFVYSNTTKETWFEYENVIQSSKKHFPLKEAREMSDLIVKEDVDVNSTDLASDDYSITIENQVQINKDDYIAFNKEFDK